MATFDVFSEYAFNIKPSEFQFKDVPLSTRNEIASAFVLYFITIYTLEFIMKPLSKPPLQKIVSVLFFINNAVLSLVSALLLWFFLETLVPMIWEHGLFSCMCSPQAWTNRLVMLYYANYICKYVELIDTVFLVVKKKKLEFLHVYHHSMTMLLCFVELEGHASVSWVPVTLNLFVHVIMYYYYALASISSSKIWWKKYLTSLQITQFVIDLIAIYYVSWNLVANSPDLAKFRRESIFKWVFENVGSRGEVCYGTYTAAIVGCSILSSYLLLFVQFFFKTYNRKNEENAKVKSQRKSRKSKKQ